MTDLGGGLGLKYGSLKLVRVPETWINIGRDLADSVALLLGPLAVKVEHVGSTAVFDMLAKPIIDLAIGLPQGFDVTAIEQALTEGGWIYRGDAGKGGGHLFVLENEPWVRVSHLHGVEHGGSQWNRYIRFRELLRRDADARATYGQAKSKLLAELGTEGSRKMYTERKTPVVSDLLNAAN